MRLKALPAISLLILATAIPAAAAETKAKGTIKGYECGDNCYLTIKTTKGEEITGLCSAEACQPWNEKAEMPKKMIGKKVRVTIGTGQQTDADGNVMGEMPAFTKLTISP